MRVAIDADFHSLFAQGGISWADWLCRRPTRAHHQPQRLIRGQIHLIRHDLKQARYPGFDLAEKLSAHAAKIDLRTFVANLDDEFVAGFVGEGAGIVDPAAERRAVGREGSADKGDAGLFEIFDTEDDFRGVALGVVADVMEDEFLLEPAEVVVAGITDEVGAVVFVADMDGVATEHVEKVGEDVGGMVGDVCWFDRRWTEEAVAVEAGEDFARVGKEGGEVEGEVIWLVAWAREDVALDLEVSTANLDEDFGFEEL